MRGMRLLFLGLGFCYSIAVFKLNRKDWQRFLDTRVMRKLKEISYVGLIRRIEILGGHYPIGQYLSQAAVLGTLCGLLCYATTDHFIYSVIIASLTIFFLPSFFYMNLKRLAQEKEEKEMLTYVSTAIFYIREDKNSLRILKDCSALVEAPLKRDLEICVNQIEDNSDFAEALDNLEKKYEYSQVRNLHLLLKGKKIEGGRNEQLVDYLFDNTEESELLINDYRQKKAAGRSVFYFMLVLNLLAALVMKKMFHSSVYVNLATEAFRFCIFLFYLLNAATLFLYEYGCSRNDKLE